MYLAARVKLVLFFTFRHAAQYGINLMTFEDEQELVKIQKLFPAARSIKNLVCIALSVHVEEHVVHLLHVGRK